MATEIKVISSQAIKEAFLAFAPEFERTSGYKVVTTWNGTNDILKKLRAGEAFDMVILVTPSMEDMIKEGKVVAGSRVDLVRSLDGMQDVSKERHIFVRADRAVPYGELMDVLEILRGGGYNKLKLVALEGVPEGAVPPPAAPAKP